MLAIAGFAGAVALGLLLLGPWAMDLLFDDAFTYGRWGLALVALGMGAHLTAGTLNQAALARDRAGAAAACWLFTAAAFVVFMVSPLVDDELLRARSATAGRRRCCARCSPSLYRATSAFGLRARATYDWPFLTILFFCLTKSRTVTVPRLTRDRAVAAVLGQPLRAAHGRGAVPALVRKRPLPSPHSRRTFFLRRRAAPSCPSSGS